MIECAENDMVILVPVAVECEFIFHKLTKSTAEMRSEIKANLEEFFRVQKMPPVEPL